MPCPGPMGCCGGTCDTKICVDICGYPSIGATVTVKRSGVTIASGTTVSPSGCVVLNIGTAGSSSVTVSVPGLADNISTQSLTCSGTTTIGIYPTDAQCCGSCGIPNSLTLTDALGALAFTWNGSSAWLGSRVISTTVTPMSGTNGGGCLCGVPITGSLTVNYVGRCVDVGGGVYEFQVTRSWGFVVCLTLPTYVEDGAPCFQTINPNNPAIDSLSLTQAWSACVPYAWSGTLGGPTATPDPVGGTVTVTA